ncbi:MAG: zf-HC2 domain-containing protein [Candidatus Acidiferrales bacterium]
MKNSMSDCDKIRELLSLAAAGVLEPEEESRISQHLRTCNSCAAELENWQQLARGLRRLPTPQPPANVVERARVAAEIRFSEEAEQRWNRNVLAFLIAFAWTVTVLSWPVFRILSGGLESWFTTRLTQTWYAFAGLTALGWLAGGIAAMILAWHQRRERRLA